MSFIGVAIGDLHLDKLTKYWPNANAMQLASARGVIRSAKRRGASRAFYLGDLAEGIRDNTGNAMRLSEPAQCLLLSHFMEMDKEIESHVILGNHDWASEGSHSLSMFIEMQKHGVFKQTFFYPELDKVKIDGRKIAMMPYPNVEPPNGCELGFAHYEVSGAVGDNGRAVHSQDEFEWSCPIIQGHLHTHQRVRNHYYPGTLYQTSFGENEDKGYGMFHMGNKFQYKWVRNETPFKLVNLRINKREDFKQLVSDELTLFKLFVHEDVRVPDDLLMKYPNIVNRLAFANEEEAVALEHDEFNSENQRIDLDDLSVLPDYLESKGGTKKQVERAVQIVEDFRVSKKS